MDMDVRELAVRDAYEFIPRIHRDGRGQFAALFQEPALLDALGRSIPVAQTNHSVSRRGAIRGVHFADTPPGQAKYVYCPAGALLDIVVDVRVGSPTFGVWDAVRLDAEHYRAVYIAEGIGHAFVALTDNTALGYLCSTGYKPEAEHGINPLDPALELPIPADLEPVLSAKDRAAPTLAEAESAGVLPDYGACLERYAQLRPA
jgi:5-epimerase